MDNTLQLLRAVCAATASCRYITPTAARGLPRSRERLARSESRPDARTHVTNSRQFVNVIILLRHRVLWRQLQQH